jgi:hypothetical protein
MPPGTVSDSIMLADGGSSPSDSARVIWSIAAFSRASCSHPSGLKLRLAISDSRAFMVATIRARAMAWPGISRSIPNCASTCARSDAIAEIVATACMLSFSCGSASDSQAGSGSQGSAGSPAALR